MASGSKYEHAIEASINAEIDWFGTTDTFKLAIHSDAPVAGTDDELADLTQITGTGYTAGGDDLQNDSTRSGGTVTVTAQDITWTGGSGGFTTGRYLSAQDDTSTTDILMKSYDYGSNFDVAEGETFTADAGASFDTWA